MTSPELKQDDPPMTGTDFRLPPASLTNKGAMRRVGFELEFSGISLDSASDAVADTLSMPVVHQNNAEHHVPDEQLGRFAIEIDWEYLKNQARSDSPLSLNDTLTTQLRELAKGLVPVEVVCPPIQMDELDMLEPIVTALHNAGAEGTRSSPLAAFGVHINAETPSMDSRTLHRYLRAFCLLQWWLMKAHDLDFTRKHSPFVKPYPEEYMHSIHGLIDPSTDELLEHYLDSNDTRNRALDMLPLFAEHDEQAVQSATGDSRINPRPAFHYRLPNCDIDNPDWSLAQSWNRWWIVERLADDLQAIEMLTADFLLGSRGPYGVNEKTWIYRIDTWVRDCGLA